MMLNRKKIIDQLLPVSKYGYYYRLVEVEDAEFILSLRNNEKLARFINKTSNKLEEQINWIKEYKKREEKGEDFYFICLTADMKTKLGLNRIYDIESNSCEIGSWLFSSKSGQDKAILGDLFCRSIAFEALNLKICRIAVRKKNKPVLRYTKSFNPKLVFEDELSFNFELKYNEYKEQRDKLLNILGYE
ncbi:MAG: GNAT family N-acetyltransferase [Flavobacteriaceae bacterium]|nr:GNAT family N-acetyltransferase [Flavobacteriaceae bacterium]